VRRHWIGGVLALGLALPTAVRAASQSLQITIPAGALTGKSDAPPIRVTIVAADGSVDLTANDRVGIEIGANPTAAALLGTVLTNANQGVAEFRDVTLDRGGDGFTLVAWSPRLADVTSAPFAFTLPPEPRDVLGYGCASTAAGELAVFGLLAIFLFPRRRGRRSGLTLALALAAASAASAADAGKSPERIAAPAQQPVDVARALNKQGIDALAQGRFDQAIALFEQARKSVNAPSLTYNLAEAHRRAGHVAEAIELYHAYIAAVPDPSKRADVSDFERLERRQIARQAAVTPEPSLDPPRTYEREALDSGPAPIRRRWMRAPGIFAGVAWLPKDQRAGYETLLEVEAWNGFRFSAGALISPRPGGRVALEQRLYHEDEFSVGFALRGMVASFPGSPIRGGGGGFSLRYQATDNVDISSGVFLEYYATQTERFLTPIVTAGIGLHL
jgi:hypothetical protein